MVIPAILEHDRELLARKITLALSFSSTVHIDLIDHAFGQVTTMIEPDFFKPYTRLGSFELHMMVANPSSYIKAYSQAGFSRLIGHVEHMSDPIEFIQKVHHSGKEAFLGIDLNTSVETALDFDVQRSGLAGITIMTVRAGQSGRSFENTSLDKIRQVKAKHRGVDIEVDGGINETTLVKTRLAGASLFAVTSSIFNTDDPAGHLNQLTHLASF